jgi:S-adenosylmethionine hydrolase
VLTGRGDILIGPDNGLLMPAAARLGGIRATRELENRTWMLPDLSATFHGRDIFAPVAAHLAIGGRFEDAGGELDPASLQLLRFPDATVRPGALETSVIYIDSFGNLRLAGSRTDLDAAVGALETGRRLRVEFAADGDSPPTIEDATWARTFGEIPAGEPLVYEDSFGELAYADNQSSVANRLGIAVDRRVRITPG